MKRSSEIPLDAGRLLDAARALGLPGKSAERIPSPGIINAIYLVDDDYILRVPLADDGRVQQTRREASVIPAVTSNGVATPRLVAFDGSCSRLPVPFTIVERVPGVDAESAGLVPPQPPETWRRLGTELALVHSTSPPADVVGDTDPSEERDIHALLEKRASGGWISALEADRLHHWTLRLAKHAAPQGHVLLHGDAQMSNVLVETSSGAFSSLIDWGCAHMGSPAVDFRVVPLAAVVPMLDGYRQALGQGRASLQAEILLARLRLILDVLPRGAAPACTWGERPLAWLADLFLTLMTDADGQWSDFLPAASGS